MGNKILRKQDFEGDIEIKVKKDAIAETLKKGYYEQGDPEKRPSEVEIEIDDIKATGISLNKLLDKLEFRLSAILREQSEDDKAGFVVTDYSPNIYLANKIREAGGKSRLAELRIKDILNRIEL